MTEQDDDLAVLKTFTKEKSLAHKVKIEKLAQYNLALKMLSEVSTTLYPYNANTSKLIYDQLYILECLIFAEAKKLEDEINGEKVQNPE